MEISFFKGVPLRLKFMNTISNTFLVYRRINSKDRPHKINFRYLLKIYVITVFTILSIGCEPKDNDDNIGLFFLIANSVPGEEITTYQNKSRLEMLRSFDSQIIEGLAESVAPDASGAMGRNKSAYFHVRFQFGIQNLADYSVVSRNPTVLDTTIKAIEYSFNYQKEDGNFEIVVPNELNGQTPNAADFASGVSFFLSSLGLALVDFNQSEWYNSSANASFKSRVESLRPKIDLAATWLLSQKQTLQIGDQNAPNRLFFNSLAFYSLGIWLDRDDLLQAGKEFAELGIAKITNDGYFLEGGGWDSSYQGVANNVAIGIFSILEEDKEWKTSLWNTIVKGTSWQRSRILPSGEISLEGNTRVYPGGESFLGVPKAIDWKPTMSSFLIRSYYTTDAIYLNLGNRVKGYYNQ
ncbi:hypothetical protein [Leptospira sp. GIMC2001]|uniref:hypothetical protein n=1 Tax=Leptospira sp. GIMC2001 TaxID=1513297 RepID=UPI0023496614|nr:hypothetical protein [Leptospira sp. GIMC2001]WCL49761.1 hypothetical protein O4O04_02770 [Leptospira sp. GIMC2001]